MSFLARKTRLMKLGHIHVHYLVSLENQYVTIPHSVGSQCLNTISVQIWSTGTELSEEHVITPVTLVKYDSC